MSPGPARVAIVGGGMAGLSTAYHLLRDAAGSRDQLEIRLYEASEELGGVIRTEREAGYLLDLGPDSIFTPKPEGLQLARELGLDSELIEAHTERPVRILWNGRLHPSPAGWSLVAPTDWRTFVGSSLFSVRGKARVALELLVPPRGDDADESIGAFVRRRFGNEVVERMADPLLAGIHAGDPERLSIRHTFPQLPALEREHGSIIRGLRRQQRRSGGGSRRS